MAAAAEARLYLRWLYLPLRRYLPWLDSPWRYLRWQVSFGCGGPGWSSEGVVASHPGTADSILAASQGGDGASRGNGASHDGASRGNGASHDGASHDGASHGNGVSPPVSPASIMPSPYEPSHRWGTLLSPQAPPPQHAFAGGALAATFAAPPRAAAVPSLGG